MWEAYKKYSNDCGVKYDDKLVLDSIEELTILLSTGLKDFILMIPFVYLTLWFLLDILPTIISSV